MVCCNIMMDGFARVSVLIQDYFVFNKQILIMLHLANKFFVFFPKSRGKISNILKSARKSASWLIFFQDQHKRWEISTFEIFSHCRCASVVARNQDSVILVACTKYVFIVDFRSFFDAKLWKMIPENDFPLTFDHQKKLTELWPFSKKKSDNYTALWFLESKLKIGL